MRARLRADLARALVLIEAHDLDYAVRNVLVLHAVAAAAFLGYPAGYRVDPDDPAWPVAYIELPTGQVSWHLPQHPTAWDGHTTAEKYARVRAFAALADDGAPPSPAAARLLALAELAEGLASPPSLPSLGVEGAPC